MYSERKQVTYCRFGAQAYAQRKTRVLKSSGLVTRDGVPAAAVGAGITLFIPSTGGWIRRPVRQRVPASSLPL